MRNEKFELGGEQGGYVVNEQVAVVVVTPKIIL